MNWDAKYNFHCVSCKDNENLPMDNGPEDESADEATSRNSFIPHETQDNGRQRERSPQGSQRGDELDYDRKISVNGVANHIYEKSPDENVPSFEEFQKNDRTGFRFKENSPKGPRRDGELVHDDKGSVDGATNHIYENAPDKYDPSVVEIREKDAPSSSSPSSSDSEIESVELSKEINPVINQENVCCVVEGAAPLEGALPLDVDDKPIRLTPKVRHL